MKFVSFLPRSGGFPKNQQEKLGLSIDDKIYDLENCGEQLGIKIPSRMNNFLENWDDSFDEAKKIENEIKNGNITKSEEPNNIKLISPVPHPTSCRDAYAFRQHVATARRNRGVDMIPEFDQFPVFYFTNHNSIFGEGDVVLEKDHFEKLDFELECAILIKKNGKNIRCKDADDYIAGYMIMNDFSARRLQMEEMKLNLGPAKGKDFATVLGPWLVTVDELEKFKISTDTGSKYDLEMKAFHNGKEISRGNLKDMNWTFAEIIERVSYGVELLPGDVIGSGTVGTGCYLELNGTAALNAKENNQEFQPTWLKENDEIVLEITALGSLKNRILRAEKDYSILEKKKRV